MANHEKMTTTKRSMDWLRKRGYTVCSVEQWISFPERKFGVPTGKLIKIKRDAFGFCDILAVHPEHAGTLYVQTTTRTNQAARRNKILVEPAAETVLKSSNRVHIHGWAQVGAVGKRKLWEVTVFEAILESRGISFHPIFDEE